MDVEIWNRYGKNTNTAEAAHSLVNRTGTQLKKRNQKNKEDKNSLKRKYGQSKIQSIDENIYEFESDNSQSKKVDIEEIRLRLELEIEDRKMNLKET
ncbi:hypothetical protein GLOIN_2v280613 [Rhizophagus irregularis DAOM 181602=DAOM 197198]|uniref:Uncharacterized protein n=1 Tax=Rhizophagus irregularis (strain DAOM 197198w) TaxID=1432141 RepID=A0A015N3A9_RHIIW|nr:hypothetical protein RirG_058970 [Rhizophagus irregularis DAOM 197198w]GBC31818.1 hypothetical protein GLOIN_2v280613 [Rhizophagus irregularis DAOM 181602=DAOM 197198]